MFCCGPCPVKAVLEGHTDLKYDIPFVFAEVNADQVIWMLMRDGSKHRLHTDSSQIGQNISTKAVGADRREDITASYKYPEGEGNITHTGLHTPHHHTHTGLQRPHHHTHTGLHRPHYHTHTGLHRPHYHIHCLKQTSPAHTLAYTHTHWLTQTSPSHTLAYIDLTITHTA